MLKGIKSWFFVEIEDEGKKEGGNTKSKSKSKNIKEAETAPPSKESLPESKEGHKGAVSKKFIDILFKALQENDLEGFDYLEFKKSLQSLKKMDMDVPTRIQSAFAMAQTMGVNKQKLLESAEFYIGILKKEEQKFESALNNQRQKQVDAKKQKIQQLEDGIKKKEEQLKKLQAEVAKHNEQINTLQTEIKGAVSKIAGTKNDFIASYNTLVNQIRQDMEHINNHLK